MYLLTIKYFIQSFSYASHIVLMKMSIAGAIFVSGMVLGVRDKNFHKMISIYKVFLPVSVKAGISLNFQIC